MLLLIDGYNLLHGSDALHRSREAKWLERARHRLLRRLSKQLPSDIVAETCVVFDAAHPPKDRPHTFKFLGILVRYAVGYPEADDLLEEIIAQHPTPRRLTVVSSDHRVQRAATRRKGLVFDADVWYDALRDGKSVLGIPWPSDTPSRTSPVAEKPNPDAISAKDVQQWMDVFQGDSRAEGIQKPKPRRVASSQRMPGHRSGTEKAKNVTGKPKVKATKPSHIVKKKKKAKDHEKKSGQRCEPSCFDNTLADTPRERC